MAETNNQQMLPIDTLLQYGKYRVVRYMASGGFGNTYEVEHVELHKRLALKEFFMRGINQREELSVTVSQEENRPVFDQMREKFLREARRQASLEHQHIVEVTDFFKENQTAYYVMKLIDGTSLSAMMKQQGRPFTEDEVRRLLPQVLSALKYVHAQGLYHLDLKPGNIMMNSEGHCWLIDFGASKQMSAKESHTLSTSTGLCYTPGFAPSEQINQNTKRIGPWTDLYALGATLYNLLTNQAPPSTDDIMDDGPSAFTFPHTVSAEMRQLIIHLMKQPPKERPQSVEKVEQMLMNKDNHDAEATQFDVRPTPKPQPKPTPGSRPVQNHQPTPKSLTTRLHQSKPDPKRSLWWLLAALVCVVFFVSLIFAIIRNKTESAYGEQESAVSPVVVEQIQFMDPVLQNLIDNMVYVEGGTFRMGSNGGHSDEYPIHSVTLSSFYIGKYEVTQEEWETVIGTNPSYFEGDKRPVEQVSWDDCQEFIRKLNEMTRMTFRLPTEAEWEYAARGGNRHDDYKYAGSDFIDAVAVYEVNSEDKGKDSPDYGTHTVGTKRPNSLGLYDMSGNVSECCQDYYDKNYYRNSPQQDPCNDTRASYRVYRGGDWLDNDKLCRVSNRDRFAPNYQGRGLGLRLAR